MKILNVCTEEEILDFKENNKLQLSWRMSMPEDVFKVELDGAVVGLIEFSESMYDDGGAHINNFEVFEKGKGLGSLIINMFLGSWDKGPLYLYVNSEESKTFWEKHSFAAYDDGTGTPIHRYIR